MVKRFESLRNKEMQYEQLSKSNKAKQVELFRQKQKALKQQKRAVTPAPVEIPDPKEEKASAVLVRRVGQLEKQVETLKSRNTALKEDKVVLREKASTYRAERISFRQEVVSAQKDLKAAQKELSETQLKVKMFQEQLDELKTRFAVDSLTELGLLLVARERELKELREENDELVKKNKKQDKRHTDDTLVISKLRSRNAYLSSIVPSNTSDTAKTKESKELKDTAVTKQEIHASNLLNMLMKAVNGVTSEPLVSFLSQRITPENAESFLSFGVLFNRASRCITTVAHSQNACLGNLLQVEGGFVFCDLQGRNFAVEENSLEDFPGVYDGQPVKVIFNTAGKAVVLQTYKTVMPTGSRVAAPTKGGYKGQRAYIEYVQLPRKKVLLIASRFVAKYSQILRNHGLDVQVFNSYEESLTRLPSMADWADLILVCTRHTSHSALEILDSRVEKTCKINRDNKNTLFIHAKQALAQQGYLTEPLEDGDEE